MFEIGQVLNKENYTLAAVWCNQNGAHIEAQGGQYVIVENAGPTEEELKAAWVAELKGLLADSDYKAIKYAEGLISEEEYAETKDQRQAWRDEINELENNSKIATDCALAMTANGNGKIATGCARRGTGEEQ